MTSTACIILAAGEGTRMKSALPKVMHRLAGRTMLSHVIAGAVSLEPGEICVVIGPGMDDVAAEAASSYKNARIAVQHDRLGTGDAVRCALPQMQGENRLIFVLYGDTPLVTPQSLAKMKNAIDGGASVAVLGFRARDPKGYGRLLTDEHAGLIAIREEADASSAERDIDLCNSGVMAFDGAKLGQFIDGLTNNNAKGEYYLTDVVAASHAQGLQMAVVECPESEVQGVNSRAQLAVVEAVIQETLRQKAMDGGATLVSPETVFLSHDTVLGRDVHVESHVIFGPGVRVEDGATIAGFSHLEEAHVGKNAQIGPYARLRPGADIGANARIGNFVEVKNAKFGDGAKANHLSYVGDSVVGARANIGAGTITCNYDGQRKSQTIIGANAFIGSNSSLVAPVKIGDGAYIGSSSVITKDVSSDALALTRSEQREISDWARRKAKADDTSKS